MLFQAQKIKKLLVQITEIKMLKLLLKKVTKMQKNITKKDSSLFQYK